MASKVAKDALRRISKEIPELSAQQLALIEACLDDCFEVGKAWDSIPILINEAQPPKGTSKESKAHAANAKASSAKQPKAAGSKS